MAFSDRDLKPILRFPNDIDGHMQAMLALGDNTQGLSDIIWHRKAVDLIPVKRAKFDKLVHMAKAVLPTQGTACWLDLAWRAAWAWPDECNDRDNGLVRGGGVLTRADFIQGRVDIMLALSIRWRGWETDIRFFHPSCAHALFALHALFPERSRAYDPAFYANVLGFDLDPMLIEGIQEDGFCEWRDVLAIVLPWLRRWRAARNIQRAFRERRSGVPASPASVTSMLVP